MYRPPLSTSFGLIYRLTDFVAEHREAEVLEDVEDIHHDQLEAAIDVDVAVLDVLDVLDERVDVSLGLLDLRLCQTQLRSERVQQLVQHVLQLSQQAVQVRRRLIGCGRTGRRWVKPMVQCNP